MILLIVDQIKLIIKFTLKNPSFEWVKYYINSYYNCLWFILMNDGLFYTIIDNAIIKQLNYIIIPDIEYE